MQDIIAKLTAKDDKYAIISCIKTHFQIQILACFQSLHKTEIYLSVNASTMFFSIYSTLSKTIGLKCAVMAATI